MYSMITSSVTLPDDAANQKEWGQVLFFARPNLVQEHNEKSKI